MAMFQNEQEGFWLPQLQQCLDLRCTAAPHPHVHGGLASHVYYYEYTIAHIQLVALGLTEQGFSLVGTTSSIEDHHAALCAAEKMEMPNTKRRRQAQKSIDFNNRSAVAAPMSAGPWESACF